MSPREEAQTKLVTWLVEHSTLFNAPFGVLTGLDPIARGGKVRSVTFGCARTLDAYVMIFSTSKIVIEGRGPLSTKVSGTFDSVDAVISHLKTKFNV